MNIQNNNTMSLVVRSNSDFETTRTHVIEALKTEGFGVLTEIDVKETLKSKIGVDFPSYKILGACNPALSHRALTIDPEVGVVLPCNVTVRQVSDGSSEVALVDPLEMLKPFTAPAMMEIAKEARAKMEKVAEALKTSL